MTADDALLGALRALAAALDALRQPAMIIGGIAVIARGVPRRRSTSTRPWRPLTSISNSWWRPRDHSPKLGHV